MQIDKDIIETIPDKECGVNEDMFPCLGTCCRKNSAVLMASYEKTCPYCEVSASLPYGASLRTAIIFECSRFGYSKRATE